MSRLKWPIFVSGGIYSITIEQMYEEDQMTITIIDPQPIRLGSRLSVARSLRLLRSSRAQACHGFAQSRASSLRQRLLTVASLAFDLLLVCAAVVLVWAFVTGWQWTSIAGSLG